MYIYARASWANISTGSTCGKSNAIVFWPHNEGNQWIEGDNAGHDRRQGKRTIKSKVDGLAHEVKQMSQGADGTMGGGVP